MKIYIFMKPFFLGSTRDKDLLNRDLKALGHEVEIFLNPSIPTKKGDINIHLENIEPKAMPWARINWLIPNHEWLTSLPEELKTMDLVLCKTKEAKRILDQYISNTFFLGFTSKDQYLPEVEKDYRSLFHYQGGTSWQRGSFWLERTWSNDLAQTLPHLTITRVDPPSYEKGSLTVMSGPMQPSVQFHTLQNRCGIHLCPSETEGFGHSLNEARSIAAVVITLDAPSMNELISDKECLIPFSYKRLEKYGYADLYRYDPRELVKKVQTVVSWPKEKLQAIGLENRKRYLQEQEEFRERLKKILSDVKIDKNKE